MAFRDIFPFSPEISVEWNGRTFMVDDLFCVRPKCPCRNTVLDILPNDKRQPGEPLYNYPVVGYDYMTHAWHIEESGGEDEETISGVISELKKSQLYRVWRKHHQMLKTLYKGFVKRGDQDVDLGVVVKRFSAKRG